MNDGAEVRDETLLRRLADGDEEAFTILYARHHRPLFRFALHMTGRVEAAEEVVQESFMALLREAGKYDPGRGAPPAFLFGIARNHVRRLLDADGRYLGFPDEGPGGADSRPAAGFAVHSPDFSGEIERAELSSQVRRAVFSLPERYREVITLCDLEEMDYERAAAILACPIGTVRSRLNRAREMLAGKLRALRAVPRPAAIRATGTE
ncbi:MAG TPA: sigma-70 family RNA polymerase sigma factor [Candidatus Acidoferrales bacterium]|nr:sigma-70 family RNA polymerase sigma factor [Candidatus Acidoferrales bacterium]